MPGTRGLLGALALAAAVSVVLWLRSGEDGRPEWVTGPVERGAIVAAVTATGRVDPRTSVDVGTYVSGPILAIDADFNSPVRKGQRIAKIDPRTFAGKVDRARADLALAEANVARAEAALELERSRLRRQESLGKRSVVSQEELDIARSNERQAEAELQVARAEIERAKATLAEAEVNLGYTDIVSPIDGVVISRAVDVGQTVAATFQTPVLFVIANDLAHMQVLAFVNEADIGRVREGQQATFTVDAFPGREFPAVVRQVRQTSEPPATPEPVVSYVVTYDVVLDVDNADGLLRPGMTANVRIVTAEASDVLTVPSSALRFEPPGTDRARPGPERGTVYRLEDGAPSPVEVGVGITDDLRVEVDSPDLAPGDRVVTRIKTKPGAQGWSLFGRGAR